MDRAGINSVRNARQRILDMIQTPDQTFEIHEKTINKFLAGEIFEKEDMLEEAKKQMGTYNHDFEKQFRLIENFENFDVALEDFQIETEQLHVLVYGKPIKRWVMICVVQENVEENVKTTVFYKDPCGDKIPSRLFDRLKEKYPSVEVINNEIEQQQVDDEPSYGPSTLRNIGILLKHWNDKKNKLSDFSTILFPLLDDLKNQQFQFVIKESDVLKENKRFLEELKGFLRELPKDLAKQVKQYAETLDNGSEIDIEDFRPSENKNQKQFFSEADIEEFQNNYESKDQDDHGIRIEKEFPEEINKLNNIFKIIGQMKVDKNLLAVLKTISEKLEIDYEDLRSFYEQQIGPAEQEESERKLASDDIDEIAKNLPEMRTGSECIDCATLDQIMAEVVIGMDKVDSTTEADEDDDDDDDYEKNHLKAKYFAVEEAYEAVWKDSTITDIHAWAVKTKGRLDTSEESVCEAIAIMDRAFNLVTGGYRLRIPQILSVIIFLHGNRVQGRLSQIKTGEGKTNIVALLAIVKCLQGHTVDVLTSSPILAQEGVDETRTLLSVFGLTVATNNRPTDDESKYTGACYEADVLYGTIGNFQFDYLKESLDGDDVRHKRKFDIVILDEVDSMLIDNGGHVAKLANPYPGMECLRYVYLEIWKKLHDAENEYVEETQREIQKIIDSYDDLKEAEVRYAEYEKRRLAKEREILKGKIRASGPIDMSFVPEHLKTYVSSQLETWMKNAIHAKYSCKEHKQYRLITDKSGEKKIAPVDYLNTGVTMRNTIWSKGLHQFVQIKHNLQLTFETLTSSFVSNIGYIKLYKSENIYGMTGTLGSRAEQELLSSIYDVDYAKIPTFRRKNFEELAGIVVDDEIWASQVAIEILAKTDDARAVLAIFETQDDLFEVEHNLRILQPEGVRIRLYSSEEHADQTKERANVGDVILATNIAGRGTNFKTTKVVEGNGGLHVMVGFLPVNLRVEGQAFGRTSRQGNNGTAQLILRKSETEQIGMKGDENINFVAIKDKRDQLERERLYQIRHGLVKELTFKDELYRLFADLHRELKRNKSTEEYDYVLKDLKEFWANWLEKKQFRSHNIDTEASIVFEEFKKEARSNIEGKIRHNPYYAIALADFFLENGNTAKAKTYLETAMEISDEKNVPGAHMKMFEVYIEQANAFYYQILQVVEDFLKLSLAEKDPNLSGAKSSIKTARSDLTKEIDHIEKLLDDPKFIDIINADEEDAGLLKHLKARLYCLKIHCGNIDEVLKQLNQNHLKVALESRTPANLKNLLVMMEKSEDRELLSDVDIVDFESVGMNIIYSVKTANTIPDELRTKCLVLIGGGVVALGVGLAFFPIFPMMSTLAATLLSDAVVDLAMAVLFGQKSDETLGDYVKAKFISMGASMLTFGIGAIVQVVKVIKLVIQLARKFSRNALKSFALKSLAKESVKSVRQLHSRVSQRLTVVKFNRLPNRKQLAELKRLLNSNLTKELKNLGGMKKLEKLRKMECRAKAKKLSELFKEGLVKIGKETARKLKETIYNDVIIPTIARKVTGDLIDKINAMIEESIRSNKKLMEKLRTSDFTQIQETVDRFAAQDLTKHHPIVNVANKLREKKQKKVVEFLKEARELTEKNAELIRYVKGFANYLEKHLKPAGCDNDVEDVVEKICITLQEKIFSLWCNILKSNIAMVGSMAKETKKAIKDKKIADEVLIGGAETALQVVVHVHQYYAIFGLVENAPLVDVTRQYRRLRLIYHDDPTKSQLETFEKAYQHILNTHPMRNI
ncbi:uncharacterized protein LOC135131053 [Zophobas morio]|uniref:uncharacterized protein LOC135131053 n=1 Tax=Zophobas morio TaxID=2755281 RepID=UPI0030839E28